MLNSRARVVGVASSSFLPCLPAQVREPHRRRSAQTGDRRSSVIFFVADGMRQDLVAVLRGPKGRCRRCAKFLKHGREGQRRRPADPGAAEHRRRLVQPRHRRLAGRPRLDEQHVPHQRAAVREPHRGRSTRASSRPRRSPSPPSAAARRSPRSSGPAAATARSTARRSTSSRSSPAAAWRRTTSAAGDRSTTRLHRLVRPPVRPPGRVRRPGAVPGRSADRRHRLDGRSGSRSARRRRCACACSTSASTSTA